jgi:hypothetical protein
VLRQGVIHRQAGVASLGSYRGREPAAPGRPLHKRLAGLVRAHIARRARVTRTARLSLTTVPLRHWGRPGGSSPAQLDWSSSSLATGPSKYRASPRTASSLAEDRRPLAFRHPKSNPLSVHGSRQGPQPPMPVLITNWRFPARPAPRANSQGLERPVGALLGLRAGLGIAVDP